MVVGCMCHDARLVAKAMEPSQCGDSAGLPRKGCHSGRQMRRDLDMRDRCIYSGLVGLEELGHLARD